MAFAPLGRFTNQQADFTARVMPINRAQLDVPYVLSTHTAEYTQQEGIVAGIYRRNKLGQFLTIRWWGEADLKIVIDGRVGKPGEIPVAGIGGGMLQFLAAFVIAGIVMAYGQSGGRGSLAIFERLVDPARGGELARLCAQGEECDLLRAAFVVAQLDDEELDIDAYVQQVDRMAQEIAQSLPKDADEPARLAALNKYLFTDNGFHGSRTDYYHRANSHLSRVIDDREGLPITLSILYMELAKRLDMNVVGIGLPGHFVVKHIPRQGDEQLIDVFEGAVPLSREEAAKRVRAMANEELDDDHLRPFSKPQIVRRVLRNLLGVAQDAKDREAMLRSLEALVAIQPDNTADRGLLAVARFETGRREAAITGLDWFLEQQPPGIDLDVIRTLQDRFRNATPPQ
jgi:regulator of sirC expression with transglutaminase-like and TPR domain